MQQHRSVNLHTVIVSIGHSRRNLACGDWLYYNCDHATLFHIPVSIRLPADNTCSYNQTANSSRPATTLAATITATNSPATPFLMQSSHQLTTTLAVVHQPTPLPAVSANVHILQALTLQPQKQSFYLNYSCLKSTTTETLQANFRSNLQEDRKAIDPTASPICCIGP